MNKAKIQFLCALMIFACFCIIVAWIIYSIWVEKNLEWINKIGQTSIVILFLSYGIGHLLDEII